MKDARLYLTKISIAILKKYKKNLTQDDENQLIIAEEILEKLHSEHHKNGNGNGNGNGFRKPPTGLWDISIKIKCLNEKQKTLKNAIEEKDLVICTGPAGTGKTFVSLLTALSMMKKDPKYQRLHLVKSLLPIPGENPGTLPGTLEEKIDPFYYSFTGNLDKIFKFKSVRYEIIKQGLIELTPIAFIRGVTIDNAIVIVDESQNIDIHTFRTIITRMGNNCKMIFLGDVDQIDRKNKNESCLSRVSELFKGFPHSESVTFTAEESVRNPIIPDLLELLKNEK